MPMTVFLLLGMADRSSTVPVLVAPEDRWKAPDSVEGQGGTRVEL